jgi:glucose-6-phosphate dehydrogenase assembly protein OpcA
MPTVYKVLGQSNPAATTLTSLYTVPASTATVVSSISVANLTATAATFRIAIRPAGASIANQHYIIYDANIMAKDTATLSIGFTLATTDVVTVYASTANLSFSIFGVEIS